MPAVPVPTPTPTPEPTPTPTPEPCLRIIGPNSVQAGTTYEFSVLSAYHNVSECTAEILGGDPLDITWVRQDPKEWDGEIAVAQGLSGETIQLDADDSGGCRALKDVEIS